MAADDSAKIPVIRHALLESEKFYNWLENSDKYTLTLLNNPYSITKFYLKGMFFVV